MVFEVTVVLIYGELCFLLVEAFNRKKIFSFFLVAEIEDLFCVDVGELMDHDVLGISKRILSQRKGMTEVGI